MYVRQWINYFMLDVGLSKFGRGKLADNAERNQQPNHTEIVGVSLIFKNITLTMKISVIGFSFLLNNKVWFHYQLDQYLYLVSFKVAKWINWT